jgi:hypothetical protein
LGGGGRRAVPRIHILCKLARLHTCSFFFGIVQLAINGLDLIIITRASKIIFTPPHSRAN